jgi:hypothetical protein
MPSTDGIIDVLIAIDADTILKTYGPNIDSAHPVQVSNAGLIFMLTKQANALSGEAGTELNLSAQTMDVIRWRETTMSLNSAYTGILYAFVPTAGGNLISTPTPLEADVTEPLPDPSNPAVPKTQTVKSYFWNSTVLAAGQVTYHFQFLICDRNGAVQGYYWWDPYITISN